LKRSDSGIIEPRVRGVALYSLPRFADARGVLTVADVGAQIPFAIERAFLVYDVPSPEVRGEHAHRTLHQFLVCVHGSCLVLVDDGNERQEFRLDVPTLGLYIPPMVWSIQYRHSRDAMMLVLASAPYDPADYIRDYETFQELTSENGRDMSG
jgi:dTDP-4-dehydrorhamnose 3,5-epimerase-like enzyme